MTEEVTVEEVWEMEEEGSLFKVLSCLRVYFDPLNAKQWLKLVSGVINHRHRRVE
jgi:hypothetical protein